MSFNFNEVWTRIQSISKILNDSNDGYIWHPRECMRCLTFNTIHIAFFDVNTMLDMDSKSFQEYNECVEL